MDGFTSPLNRDQSYFGNFLLRRSLVSFGLCEWGNWLGMGKALRRRARAGRGRMGKKGSSDELEIV